MRLKIFSDPSGLPEGVEPVPLLQPFWNAIRQPTVFGRYAEIAPRLFELTSLAEAQYAVAPCDWKYLRKNEALREVFFGFVRQAREQGKKTIVFFEDDSQEAVPGGDLIVFRPSLSRSAQRENEFATPAWIADFAPEKQEGAVLYRTRQTVATVGFCGCPHGGFGPHRRFSQQIRWLWALLKHRCMGRSLGRYNRGMALRLIAQSDRIRSNFIINDAFFVKMIRKDPTQKRVLREAFFRNTMESDYVLCVRGAGNFSYRFYEALSCGRIPALVDTDCVLPLENVIDYRQFCVWIPERDLRSIASRIVAFHEGISAGEFISLQKRCRLLWRKHLSPEGYFSEMAGLLSAIS